ncbi:MAG TPA: DUF929 family protein [Jatrophihabitantaceae bacterium]|jgi:hypothetical protein|nr:DUF929 family protein [Jatrophihabitantaceae bacterium]
MSTPKKAARPPRPVVARTAAQKRLAAQRAMASVSRARAEKRRRLLRVLVPVVGVVAVVGLLVVVKVATGAGRPKSGVGASLASAQVVRGVSNVAPAVFDQIGKGTSSTPPSAVTASPLTVGGKPQILYVGAEYCPFCAVERWPMAVALSRFGTFTNLGATSSSSTDVYPSTASLSFHGATYASKYISFTGKEIESNQIVGNQYAPLDTLTADEQRLFNKYDFPPYATAQGKGAIPFADLGGKYLIHGAGYDPQLLQGKSAEEVASALADPTSKIAQAVNGSANVITAAICTLTKDAPANVCSSAGVTVAGTALKAASSS